jgi:hypothetical protein
VGPGNDVVGFTDRAFSRLSPVSYPGNCLSRKENEMEAHGKSFLDLVHQFCFCDI